MFFHLKVNIKIDKLVHVVTEKRIQQLSCNSWYVAIPSVTINSQTVLT